MHFSVTSENMKNNFGTKSQKDVRFLKNQKGARIINASEKENYHHTQYMGMLPPQEKPKLKQMKINRNTVNLTLNEIHFQNN